MVAFSQRKKSSSFDFLCNKKKKILLVIQTKTNVKNIGSMCIFLDSAFCLDAEELKNSLPSELECQHKCMTLQCWQEEWGYTSKFVYFYFACFCRNQDRANKKNTLTGVGVFMLVPASIAFRDFEGMRLFSKRQYFQEIFYNTGVVQTLQLFFTYRSAFFCGNNYSALCSGSFLSCCN